MQFQARLMDEARYLLEVDEGSLLAMDIAHSANDFLVKALNNKSKQK
jgi:hypothetical protein